MKNLVIRENEGPILLTFLTAFCLDISSNDDFDYSSREDVKYIEEISNNHDLILRAFCVINECCLPRKGCKNNE